MALSQSDSMVLYDNAGFSGSSVFQYLDEVLAAEPNLLPSIRNYVEDKANELANPNTSLPKRKRGAMEDSTYLSDLFDSLAPSPSSRVILRPLKMARNSDNAVVCESRATGMLSENESAHENAQVSVTEPLEKQMELCFGVVPNKADLLVHSSQKRKRLDSGDGDGKKRMIRIPANKSIKQSVNAF